MEFTQYTCPVCQKRFENGDDVVVCPECGAPHHRECFEELGPCFYESRHAQGFNFENPDDDTQPDAEAPTVIHCPRCQAENEKTAFYCSTCGYPLQSQDRTSQDNGQQQPRGPQGIPFGFGAGGAQMFDPLAGLNSEEEIGENVKVGEAAKFIGKNTPYYLLVFNRIKKFNSGKFNFSAFLFTGAYFIYRKMYVLGIVLSLLNIGIVLGSTALMMANSWMMQMEYVDLLTSVQTNSLGADKMMMLFISAMLSLLRIGVMVFSGVAANKLYFRHCQQQINQIKSEEQNSDINKTLEARGGVNLPMAISFFASYAVIYELCNLYLVFQL